MSIATIMATLAFLLKTVAHTYGVITMMDTEFLIGSLA
jgi:hypothetical protein